MRLRTARFSTGLSFRRLARPPLVSTVSTRALRPRRQGKLCVRHTSNAARCLGADDQRSQAVVEDGVRTPLTREPGQTCLRRNNDATRPDPKVRAFTIACRPSLMRFGFMDCGLPSTVTKWLSAIRCHRRPQSRPHLRACATCRRSVFRDQQGVRSAVTIFHPPRRTVTPGRDP